MLNKSALKEHYISLRIRVNLVSSRSFRWAISVDTFLAMGHAIIMNQLKSQNID
jgi:hypothetical protein